MDYIAQNGQVDILVVDFVDEYLKQFNPKFKPTNWGAHKCPEIARYLSLCYKSNLLNRARLSLGYNWQPGFPKWVFVYYLK